MKKQLADPPKKLTYGELLEALYELSLEQLNLPAKVAKGRKVFSIWDTSLSCECKGPAVDLVGKDYPLLIGNKPLA